MLSLAIETSCDETAVAILDDERVLSNIIATQLYHSKYGGVVPEVASREHLKKIIAITDEALNTAGIKINDVELISATSNPGLVGALLIGFNFGKTLAICLNVPFVPVNHIHAHLYSNFIEQQEKQFPFISLIVSGGHTLLVLVKDFFKHQIIGTTVDDAAGEAFDKVAKLLGLGYPGGPMIDRHARLGDKHFHKFPDAKIREGEFNFSFSGIKTAVLYHLKKIDYEKYKDEKLINDLCASFQDAITETLYKKALLACEKYSVKVISVSGGVSGNSALKEKFQPLTKEGYKIYFPGFEYSTDNAAMIALAGYYKYKTSTNRKYFHKDSIKTNVNPQLDYETF